MNGITVCIPTIPPRALMLHRAIASVTTQTAPPDMIVIAYDVHREGAARTRDRALARVTTPLVAFLDDDDELRPQHLLRCRQELEKADADLVFPWFDVVGGTDPFPVLEGLIWENDKPHAMPVTVLAKTESVRAVGGFSADGTVNRSEDYRLAVRMSEQDFNIVHFSERTWIWHHHDNNTSGQSTRW